MSNNYHYLLKFVIAGDPNVGKSTIIQQFTQENHRNTYIPSQRIHFASKIITTNNLHIKCQLWDMVHSSQPEKNESFAGLANSLCKKAAAIIVLFDLTNDQTFQNLQKWLQDIRLKCDENISIILVGNKADKEERKISREQALEFAKITDTHYFEVSSFNQKDINHLFQNVSKTILDKITSQSEANDLDILKSRIKRGTKIIQTPTSPEQSQVNSYNSEKTEQQQRVEDSQQMFGVIDKLTQSLKKTCIIQQIIKNIKSNFNEQGFGYLNQIKNDLSSNRMVQTSNIINDLFDIFTMIQQSLIEYDSKLYRMSLQSEQLTKYKNIQFEQKLDKQKIQNLEKRIETLIIQKGKLQQYKQNSQKREQNLLQIIQKIKREKRLQLERHEQLLNDYSKLQSKNLALSKELNRYQQEQSQMTVQKVIEQRQNSEIIQQLDTLKESGIDAVLLNKLIKKFSINTSQNESFVENSIQLNSAIQ